MLAPRKSAHGRFAFYRLAMILVPLLLLAGACSETQTQTTLSDTQRTILELQLNTLAWSDVPNEDWFRLAQEACDLGGWEREQAIAIAQRFVDAHPEAYERQPSDQPQFSSSCTRPLYVETASHLTPVRRDLSTYSPSRDLVHATIEALANVPGGEGFDPAHDAARKEIVRATTGMKWDYFSDVLDDYESEFRLWPVVPDAQQRENEWQARWVEWRSAHDRGEHPSAIEHDAAFAELSRSLKESRTPPTDTLLAVPEWKLDSNRSYAIRAPQHEVCWRAVDRGADPRT